MSGKRKVIRRLSALLAAVMLPLSGCGSRESDSFSAAEIRTRSAAAGFLAEKTQESRGFISGTDQRDKISDYAYLYDNALTAVVLSHAGAQEQAEMIADAIVFAQEHDRLFHDGRLRNAYIAGDPRSDSGRSIAGGKVTVRLPGFWQNGKWQEDSYTVSTSTGNMGWTILALCSVAKNASAEKQTEYLDAAVKAADFVLTLESENGGFTAGYEGWDEEQVKTTYISTEHNIDLCVALSVLADALSASDTEKSEKYRTAADSAKRFVLSMYDEKRGFFYTGTLDDGSTVSDGVIPIDANCLAILSLGEALDDPYRIVSFVEERMAVGDGFDFGTGDLDGIWNEGTSQMAVCYYTMNSMEKYDTTMSYLKTQTAGDGSIPAADRDGVSTGFVVVGTDSLWEYNNVQSISATGWLAFAEMKVNPFATGLD
ncbi:MAG: hypothetical protein IJP92_11105 [Lachnospiraceae bacterium]|nr:hypothetical protein [Lachnospiraceae bacterium]